MFGLALLCLVSLIPQDPVPGIDRALARDRAARVRDVEYDLRFQLGAGEQHVRGSVWLRFQLDRDRAPGAPLVLDFAGDELTEVRVNGRETALRAVANHVLLPADLLQPGANDVHARFRSPVAPTGTPLTVYRDPADGREYCYTLVVPADAHRLYPCFDQPDLRARFRVELDLPPEWVAVANTPRIATRAEGRPAANGTLWQFDQTRPLPTYLMAFACGPFEVVDTGPVQAPGVDPTQPLRLFVRGSQLRHLDRERLATMHKQGLRWLAQRFGVDYPFGKLDVVLLPGFPYGGMEHAGAIFYRETALLFDHPPTASELVRRSTLVYHELSHQWFGNLVTMRWFDDLWLKEGFATFVAHQALAELEPEQRSWLRFLQRVKPRAYEVDATPGTTPVFQELQNLADAKSAYGAIVYNKAPAVLRQLHEQLGAEVFRQGLKRFLETHAFGAADWRDLARALEAAARTDLGRWSERWLLAPSMPQVRIEWRRADDGTVAEAAVVQRALGGDGTWPLDLELLVFAADGTRRTLSVSGDAERLPIDALAGGPAPAAVLLNPRDVAYGQFVPDPTSRAWFAQHLPDEPDPLVRAVAAQALFEAVREAELDPAVFVDLALRLLAGERDAETHGWLLDALGTCVRRYLDPARAATAGATTTALLLRQLRDEAGSGRELGTFRFLARASAAPDVLALCRAVVDGDALPQGLVPGKQDCFLAAAALLAAGQGRDDVERLQQRFANEDVGKDVFLARAATPTADAKADYWRQYLQLDTPPEQWTQDSLAWFHWPGQQELTLPYLQPALERVDWVKQNRRIFFMPAWLDAFVNAHSTPAALAIVDAFAAKAELSTDVRQKLLQSRDGLERAVRVRSTFSERK
ncbi:MAG: ERAP1-like C-terminal domain-containing protein [Planctomycetes bacterium]|nr:ERAP1-like C-terminal domain-containing protein [Planctomycetota bacterium]